MTRGSSPLCARCALMSRTTQSMMVKVRNPRKSKFHQARRFDIILVELRDRRAAALFAVQRRKVSQDGRRDDHAAGVRAGIARQTLERSRQIDELANLRFAVVQALQLFFLLERLVERHADFQRNQLRDLVHIAIRMAENPADVAHHGLGGQGAVGDDLRYPLAAVLVGDVFNHPIATFHAEVDVEVRHRYSFGIQESLEQQVMLDGIQIGDPQRIRDQRPRTRAAARTHGHAVLTCPPDEVGNDQKVSGKAHGANDAQLELEARMVTGDRRGERQRRRRGDASAQPALGFLTQKIFRVRSRRHRVRRQHGSAQANLEGTALGNFNGIGQQFRRILKQLRHFRRRFQILLFGVAALAAGIAELRAVMDADPRLMRFELRARQETHIVGRNRGDASGLGKFHGRFRAHLFTGPAGALHLEIEAIAAIRLPALETSLRLLVPSARKGLPDVALESSGQHNQSLQRVAAYPAAIQHRRTAALALQEGPRHQLGQMPVAGQILTKEHDARGRRTFSGFANPRIDADHGLDPGGLRFLVELHHGKQVALIGEGNRGHAGCRDRAHQVRNAHDAVHQGIFGVHPQVNEVRQSSHRKARRTGSKERRCKGQGPCKLSRR